MQVTEAAKSINDRFHSSTAGTRARMLAAADSHKFTLIEYRTAIRADWATRSPSLAPGRPAPTVEEAADLINVHFYELPAPARVSILRAFNICRPAFDLDYIRTIVESEFRGIRSGVLTGEQGAILPVKI